MTSKSVIKRLAVQQGKIFFIPIQHDLGDHVTIKEFNEWVTCGAVIPGFDGSGYWTTKDKESNLCCCCSEPPEWATHVMWYNK